MFESIMNFFKRFGKNEKENSKTTAKERLHLVLAQDRANISADFLEMMKQEIIEVIKKYIDIDEEAIDVRMTNKPGEDGTVGAPALYANIPIVTIKNDARKLEGTMEKPKEEKQNNIKDQEKIDENPIEENETISETDNIDTEQAEASKEQLEENNSEEEKAEKEIENKTNENQENALEENDKDEKVEEKNIETKQIEENKMENKETKNSKNSKSASNHIKKKGKKNKK